MSIFNPDSPIMQTLSRVCDLVILNFIYILTCLPVFTIGAATTALYSACFKLGTPQEDRLLKRYFRVFRESFRQSTAVFLLLALAAAITIFDFIFFSSQPGALSYLSILALPVMAVIALVWGYAFPLLSRFENTVWVTIKNAFFLGIGYMPRTLMILVLNLTPLGLFLLMPQVFFDISIMFVVIYFAGAAFVAAQLLKKPFSPYLPPEDEVL